MVSTDVLAVKILIPVFPEFRPRFLLNSVAVKQELRLLAKMCFNYSYHNVSKLVAVDVDAI